MKKNKDNEKILDEILEKVLNAITVEKKLGRGDEIGWSSSSNIEYNMSLLLSELMINYGFERRLNCIRYSFGNEDVPFELISVLEELKQNKKYLFKKDLVNKLKEKLKQIKNNYPIQKFDLYYPVNIETTEHIEPLKFENIEIKILNYDDIKDELDAKKLVKHLKINKECEGEKFTKDKYMYIHIPIRARNYNWAAQEATKYANLILGIMTSFQKYRTNSIIELITDYVFIFKDKSYVAYLGFYDKSDNRKIYKLEKGDINNLNNLINQFNDANKYAQEIILKAMNSYYLGMREKRVEYSFLNFWIALEIICLKSKNIRHAEIIERLKSIFVKVLPLFDYEIERLRDLRNDLIHNAGYDNITQQDRNLLKACAESMIIFFIRDLSKYKEDEINSIFYFLKKNDTGLKNSKKIIDFVIQLRSGKINKSL